MNPRDVMASGDPANGGRMKSATQGLKGQPSPLVRVEGPGGATEQWQCGFMPSFSLQLSPLEPGEHHPGQSRQDNDPLWGEGLGSLGVQSGSLKKGTLSMSNRTRLPKTRQLRN